MNLAEQVDRILRREGIPCFDPIIMDGQLHRYKTEGDHAANSWYVVHTNERPAVAFGCWKRGIKRTTALNCGDSRTPLNWKGLDRRISAERIRRELEKSKAQTLAKEKASLIWAKARPCCKHPYLALKEIQPHFVRTDGTNLVIPIRDSVGVLQSLQCIDLHGNKRFLKGGRVKGCFFMMGIPRDVICIAEGFATGASIHEATGYCVAIAFNTGNLLAVANALKFQYPKAQLKICADNDLSGAA